MAILRFGVYSIFAISIISITIFVLTSNFGVSVWTILPPVIAFISLELSIWNYTISVNGASTETESKKDKNNQTGDRIAQKKIDSNCMVDDVDNSPKKTKHDLIRSNEQIISDSLTGLENLFDLREGGRILIKSNNLHIYSKMILYILLARYLYETSHRNRETVDGQELMSELNVKKGELFAFLNKADAYLTSSSRWNFDSYQNIENHEFTVDLDKTSEIEAWIKSNEFDKYGYNDTYFGYAQMCISNAMDYCEEINEQPKRFNEYSSAKFEILDSLHDISDYPIAISNDSVWSDFVRAMDAALGNLDDKNPETAKHCLKQMERSVSTMSSKYDSSFN